LHPDEVKLFDSVQSIERTEHSKKPEEFRDIIDTLYTHGKQIELFARRPVEGWEVWGNDLTSLVDYGFKTRRVTLEFMSARKSAGCMYTQLIVVLRHRNKCYRRVSGYQPGWDKPTSEGYLVPRIVLNIAWS